MEENKKKSFRQNYKVLSRYLNMNEYEIKELEDYKYFKEDEILRMKNETFQKLFDSLNDMSDQIIAAIVELDNLFAKRRSCQSSILI